ncbi:hypothetical protein B0H14DRAFT_2571415 [Mycena olivaceomarginata]|nr:hypothetical protein B0H14DRAFT_2571415 [Mycena olivaceomarginata]
MMDGTEDRHSQSRSQWKCGYGWIILKQGCVEIMNFTDEFALVASTIKDPNNSGCQNINDKEDLDKTELAVTVEDLERNGIYVPSEGMNMVSVTVAAEKGRIDLDR